MHNRIDRGTSKPAKSKLTKQAFEAQINIVNNPKATNGGFTQPMMINMQGLNGCAIGGDCNQMIKQGAK